MNAKCAALLSLVLAGLLLSSSTAPAQYPDRMNYQFLLTDDLDQPLANQTVGVLFRIYDQENGGALLWSEGQDVTTNQWGVASVVLGSVTPFGFSTFGASWLELEVEGELLSPRRELTAVPYARAAWEAGYAFDSEMLGGVLYDAYALDDDLWQPGTLNNPANPLEWTKLKNVPSGFADGIDNTGPGDGHSLDASDGSPTDVVRVDADGTTYVGSTPTNPTWLSYALGATSGSQQCAGYFEAYPYGPASYWAMFARSDSGTSIIGNSRLPGVVSWPGVSAGVSGIGGSSAYGGFFVADGPGHGLYCANGTDGHALYAYMPPSTTGDAVNAECQGSGYAGYFSGGSGVSILTDDVIPVLGCANTRTSSYGDAAWFESQPGVSDITWTLYSRGYEGEAGRFNKQLDDNKYAVTVYGHTSTSEGLYVSGTIYTTAPMARGVETSRGTEAVFGVSSPDVEIMLKGKSKLEGGVARVEFDRTFAESVSDPSELVITATPVGSWSALYVSGTDSGGFDVKSGAGDGNVVFNWVAVGRARGHEGRPQVTIPDPAADSEVVRLKEEEAERNRPERDDTAEPPEVLSKRIAGSTGG